MPKLIFKYGAMSSGKSLQLLVTAHQYRCSDKRPCVVKPAIDTRAGAALISCRLPNVGCEADLSLVESDAVPSEALLKFDVILVDEVQFCTPEQVRQLAKIALHVPVIAFGLRCDYLGQLFPGTAALMALADEIVEIKHICKYCPRKATQTIRLVPPTTSSTIEIGGDDMYAGVCRRCWYAHSEAKLSQNMSEPLKKNFAAEQ